MECEKIDPRRWPQGRKGSPRGHSAHQMAGERACDECKAARAEYQKQYRRSLGPTEEVETQVACKKKTRRYPNGRTGTEAGRAAHYHAGEAPCEPCRQSSLVPPKPKRDTSKDTCSTPSRKFPEGRTGTYAGYNFHKKAGQEICEPCAEAGREYSRKAYQKYYARHREDVLVKNMRRKAMERDWRHIPYTAKQITESFGTVCYLCEHEVDLQSESGNPLSASIDHVVPLHIEEGPGDILSNVRWTHLRCNLRKRHRTVGQCALPFPVPTGDEF